MFAQKGSMNSHLRYGWGQSAKGGLATTGLCVQNDTQTAQWVVSILTHSECVSILAVIEGAGAVIEHID